MTTGRPGPALEFWLGYLDYQGGLWEASGDAVLAVLPERLAIAHDLPESGLITDDPDIAREDDRSAPTGQSCDWASWSATRCLPRSGSPRSPNA